MHNIEDTEHYILETVFASNQVLRSMHESLTEAFLKRNELMDTYIDIAQFNITGFITDGNGNMTIVSVNKFDKTGVLLESKVYYPGEGEKESTKTEPEEFPNHSERYAYGVDMSEHPLFND